MRRILPGLAFSLALAIVASSILAAPHAPLASMPLSAYAVSLNLNYSDPASDVYELWTANNSHVTTTGGAWVMSPFPPSVNLIHFQSLASGSNVDLSVRVQGSIATLSNTTYEIRLYTTSDNSTHYIVRYTNGTTNLRTNHTGSAVTTLAGTRISPGSTLNLVVPRTDLGNITSWRVDGTTSMVGKNYTFEDFIWSIPGNPGSAPAAIQGHVTDGTSGAALSGVNVSVAGFYTTTNASGYYLLSATYGNLTVSFRLSGYDALSKSVTVLANHTATLDAQLNKGATGLAAYGWIVALVLILVIVAVVAVLLLRRRKAHPPTR